jgi:uncharacterized protein HemX
MINDKLENNKKKSSWSTEEAGICLLAGIMALGMVYYGYKGFQDQHSEKYKMMKMNSHYDTFIQELKEKEKKSQDNQYTGYEY